MYHIPTRSVWFPQSPRYNYIFDIAEGGVKYSLHYPNISCRERGVIGFCVTNQTHNSIIEQDANEWIDIIESKVPFTWTTNSRNLSRVVVVGPSESRNCLWQQKHLSINFWLFDLVNECCSNAIRSHYVKHQSINYFLGPSRGKCACGKCECADGHTGNNCGCPTTNTTCLASDGVSSLLDYALYYLYVGLWSYL